jgi:quinol monooxygenase YgiN
MIVQAGTVRIRPGMRAAATPHVRALVEGSRAEPGCHAFDASFDVEDDHLLRLFEVFADEAALEAHRRTPHFAAWRASWESAGIGDRKMKRYDVSAVSDS